MSKIFRISARLKSWCLTLSKISIAVAWAVAIANNSSHGYDQRDRWGPDYDCSSLVISAWDEAGVPVKKNGASYTGNMCDAFLKSGFKDVTNKVNFSTGAGLQTGDIVWKKGHVEMMCSDTQLVGAHIAENGTIYSGQDGDQTGREINVQTYYNSPWTRALRYVNDTSDSDVISGNRYLSRSEMQTNARYIYSYLSAKGWTLNAIAGMLGNMETESTINPAIWQSLKEGNTSGGFGLTQWTPATKLIEWCESKNKDYKNINSQLERILWELENGEQYYKTDSYPETFREFSKSTKSPEYLALAFLYNYERAGSPVPSERQTQARYWYDYLSDYTPDIPDTPSVPTTPTKRKSLPLILMYIASKGMK